MSDTPIRVLCVDDHAFLIDGLQARFALETDIECVGRLGSAENLVITVKTLEPTIVLLDIEMPGPDPFDAAEELKRQCPAVRTVFLARTCVTITSARR